MDTPPVVLPYRTQLAGGLGALVSMWWAPAYRSALVEASGETLGLTEARILWELGHRGPVRLGRLAEVMDLTAPSITKAVAKLHARGLTDQTVSTTDRRVRHVELTAAGNKAVRRLYDVGDDAVQQIVAGWAPDRVKEFTELVQDFVQAAARFTPPATHRS